MTVREGTMTSTVFWDVTRCCLVEKYRHFGGTCLANRLLHTVDKRLPGYTVLRTIRWYCPVAYPGIFFGGGGSTNSVEDRENGDLGAVAP